ncbi:MAG: hypothetical protein QM687_11490 [Ferruginibacter sp.]
MFTSDFPDESNSLRDYKVPPPEELFNQVLETHQQLQLKDSFQGLVDYPIAPPSDFFENIVSLIEANEKKRKGIWVRMPVYRMAGAIAAMLIVLAGFAWLVSNHKKEQKEEIAGKTPTNNTGTVITNNTDSAIYLHPVTETTFTAAVNHTPRRYTRETGISKMTSVEVDGVNIPIENNDILYSFTKYPYGSAVNWEKGKSKKIRLDEYAGISLSPYMSEVIGTLYKTKKNGKPTYKAKRTKAKIARWKKSDNKTFDKKKNRNPLDIIDLAEHVY